MLILECLLGVRLMSNRVKLKVKNTGVFESGLNLVDDEGNFYVWYTRAYYSPLFYALSGEWFNVTATLYEVDFGGGTRLALKNVRVKKSENFMRQGGISDEANKNA